MRASTSASQARGSTPFSLAVMMREYMAAARSPPRSLPANSHDFRTHPPRGAYRAWVNPAFDLIPTREETDLLQPGQDSEKAGFPPGRDGSMSSGVGIIPARDE